MSYPKDLDEYTTIELQNEIDRRSKAIATGQCDYCGRSPDTPPCKFPERHSLPKGCDHTWNYTGPIGSTPYCNKCGKPKS